jgi:GNAT superfamily N-acetyltransferase
MEFRPARSDEADVLGRMVVAGVRHWGHDVHHPDAFAALEANALPTADWIEVNTVEVLVDDDEVLGFYGLERRDDLVELVYMFLAVDRIGTGCGRLLWDRAVDRARGQASRMLIMSDPEAKDFYAAMGAELDGEVETSPGFLLGRMWYDLTDRPAR